MIGDQDGREIRGMIERRESPSLRVRLAVETRTGLKTANVWGVLPGATDENVALMAHADAFFEGAMDNASGMATLVALAEHYAKRAEGSAPPDDDVLHHGRPSLAVRRAGRRQLGP